MDMPLSEVTSMPQACDWCSPTRRALSVSVSRQRLTTPMSPAALAEDPHPAVRAAVVLNAVLRDTDVEMLASDPIARVRGTAAASRRVQPATLTRLADDRSVAVRWAVLYYNPERLDLARKIAEDSDEMNAHQAKSQLERPRDFTAFLGDIDLVR